MNSPVLVTSTANTTTTINLPCGPIAGPWPPGRAPVSLMEASNISLLDETQGPLCVSTLDDFQNENSLDTSLDSSLEQYPMSDLSDSDLVVAGGATAQASKGATGGGPYTITSQHLPIQRKTASKVHSSNLASSNSRLLMG